MPGPMRIVEERASQRDHVGAAFGYDGLRLLGAYDQTDDARGHAGFAANLLGKRYIIAGTSWHVRLTVRAHTAGRDIDVIQASFLERFRD